jgi:hypothetical protein
MFLFLKFSVEPLLVSAKAGVQREGHAAVVHLSNHFMEALKNARASVLLALWVVAAASLRGVQPQRLHQQMRRRQPQYRAITKVMIKQELPVHPTMCIGSRVTQKDATESTMCSFLSVV